MSTVTVTTTITATVLVDRASLTRMTTRPTSKATSVKATPTTSKPSASIVTKVTLTTSIKSSSSTRLMTTATKISTTTSSKPTPTATANPVFSKKKGISYNTESFTTFLNSRISWAYNWYSAPHNVLSSAVSFAPMLWSARPDHTSIWTSNVQAAKVRGDTHLLAFNEPDFKEQSNMPVSEAVRGYKQYMQPYGKDFKLVSPAVTNGGSPMGIAYLQQFLAECTGCQVDAIALHWYDAAWNTGYFINYLSDAIKSFAPRPIWLTEFRGSGTVAEQIKFINTVVPWMEQQAGIERYAIFGLFEGSAAAGNLVTNGKLNEVGLAYAQAGSD